MQFDPLVDDGNNNNNIINVYSPNSSNGNGNGAWWEKISALIFPCIKSKKEEPMLLDLTAEDNEQYEQYRSQVRSLELQLHQSNQRLSVITLTKQKLEQECEREKLLKQQAEESLAIERRNSLNSSKSTMDDNEVERLRQQLQRLERKLTTQQKYSETIEGQLKSKSSSVPSPSDLSSLHSTLSSVQSQSSQLQAEIIQLQRASGNNNNNNSNNNNNNNNGNNNNGDNAGKLQQIAELEKAISDLKSEIAFRDQIGSKLEDSHRSSTLNAPVRQSRALRGTAPSGGSSHATPSPAPSQPPSVPNRNGSIADRMKNLQQQNTQ